MAMFRKNTWYRIGTVLTLAIFIASTSISPIKALTAEQKALYGNDSLYVNYDDDNSNATACGDTGDDGSVSNLVGSDNVERAFNYFVNDRGLSPQAAAGIVGNLMAESGVDPKIVQSSGFGHGIAQWETKINGKGSGRWDVLPPVTINGKTLVKNVKDFAASTAGAGRSMTDLSLQLDFLWHELKNFYTNSLNKMKNATSAGDAAYIFLAEVEVPAERAPGGDNDHMRRANAQDVFNRYAGGQVGEGDAGDDASGSSCTASDLNANCDETNGQVATGKAAILCEARKFDPFGYSYGGGHEPPEQFMKKFMAAGGYTQPFKQYLDCSSLEMVAIWNAFGVSLQFATSTMASVPQLKEIPIAQTQPGDLVWRRGHTEIVSSPGANTTFGAHTSHTAPARQISEAKKQSWEKAYEYIGATK